MSNPLDYNGGMNTKNSSFAVTGKIGNGHRGGRNFDRMVFAHGHCGASPEMLRRCGSGLFGLGAVFRLGHRPLRACSQTSPQDQKSSLLITTSFLSTLLGSRREGECPQTNTEKHEFPGRFNHSPESLRGPERVDRRERG